MEVDIRQLDAGPIYIRETLPADVIDLNDPTARSEQPVEVELDVVRMENEVLVTGKARTILTVLCGRCSEWMPWPVQPVEIAQKIEIPSTDSIDLTPLVREDILLALPVVASCQLDAAYRCPRNGKSYPPVTKPAPTLGTEDVWQALDKLKLKE